MSKEFENAIWAFLKREAEKDDLFRKKMESHPEKDAKSVCNYILTEVAKEVGSNNAGGFADEEIYGMAKHFIDEDDLKPKDFSGHVTIAINKSSKGKGTAKRAEGLSESDVKKIKAEAVKAYKAEESKKAKAAEAKKKLKAAEAAKAKKRAEEEKRKERERLEPSFF